MGKEKNLRDYKEKTSLTMFASRKAEKYLLFSGFFFSKILRKPITVHTLHWDLHKSRNTSSLPIRIPPK